MGEKNIQSFMDKGDDCDSVAVGTRNLREAMEIFMRNNTRPGSDSIQAFFRKWHEESEYIFTTWLMTAPLEEFDECRKAWLDCYGLGSRKRTRMPRFGC